MGEHVFNLPDLGEGLEDAEIVEWKVAEGDLVTLNQPLVEVNTAKALVEVPSPVEGVVTSLHGGAGDVVAVGAPLVTFQVDDGASEDASGVDASGGHSKGTTPPKREAVLVGYGVDTEGVRRGRRPRLSRPSPRPAEETPATGVRAAPPVRRLARERGVDLATVSGTGPGGRITREDVLRGPSGASSSPPPRAAPASDRMASRRPGEDEERIPVRGVRRVIAEHMSRAWREIPHVTTFHTADATHLEALRTELSEESGIRVSALAVVVRALVHVCIDHPLLNATYDEGAAELVVRHRYHVGIATDTERGLLVPVVRDVETKGIVSIAAEIADLSEVARAGRASPEQLTGSTITVTNVGTFGSSFGTPIINHPEVAILALGRIEPRAMVADGRVEARPALTLSLSFDHRFIDGADADRAMTDLRKAIESPFRLGSLPR